MFTDVDKFKMINDSYGHSDGDAVLIAVADRMCKVSRKEDFIARYGGGEFTIIMDLSAVRNQREGNLKVQVYLICHAPHRSSSRSRCSSQKHNC